jgi:hypothetical protein
VRSKRRVRAAFSPLKVDRRRENLKTEVKVLRLEIDAERQNLGEIYAKLRELRTKVFRYRDTPRRLFPTQVGGV